MLRNGYLQLGLGDAVVLANDEEEGLCSAGGDTDHVSFSDARPINMVERDCAGFFGIMDPQVERLRGANLKGRR